MAAGCVDARRPCRFGRCHHDADQRRYDRVDAPDAGQRARRARNGDGRHLPVDHPAARRNGSSGSRRGAAARRQQADPRSPHLLRHPSSHRAAGRRLSHPPARNDAAWSATHRGLPAHRNAPATAYVLPSNGPSGAGLAAGTRRKRSTVATVARGNCRPGRRGHGMSRDFRRALALLRNRPRGRKDRDQPGAVQLSRHLPAGCRIHSGRCPPDARRPGGSVLRLSAGRCLFVGRHTGTPADSRGLEALCGAPVGPWRAGDPRVQSEPRSAADRGEQSCAHTRAARYVHRGRKRARRHPLASRLDRPAR